MSSHIQLTLPAVLVSFYSMLSIVGLSSRAIEAQLFIINEIKPGTSDIELRNIGVSGPASNSSICISTRTSQTYSSLPNGGVVPNNGYVQVTLGVAGVNTPTRLFLPALPPLALSYGAIILYFGPVPSSLNMQDYVSYGGATSNMLEAYGMGLWTLSGSAPAPSSATQSLVYDGTGHGPDEWYVVSTPTIGSPNSISDMYPFGAGCNGGGPIPVLRRSVGQRPLLGTTFNIETSPCPAGSPVALIIGAAQLAPPIDLSILGFTGCLLYVRTDVIISGVSSASGTALVSLGLPASPPLVGSRFFCQWAVIDGSAPGGASFSNAAAVLIGSS